MKFIKPYPLKMLKTTDLTFQWYDLEVITRHSENAFHE